MTDVSASEYTLPLRFAVMEITNRCNLRCAHCASTSGIAREGELSFEEISSLLADIKDLGGEKVTVIGGEALMREDWFDICARINELGMHLSLISNGVRISLDETLPKLKALQPKVIGISLDGATRDGYLRTRGVDKFDHVMTVLHALRDDGHKNVNAITTLTKENLRELDTFANLLDNTGITWQVQLAHRAGGRFDDALFLTLADYTALVHRLTDIFRHRPTLHLLTMDDFGYCPIDPALKFLHQAWKGCSAGRQLIGVRSDGVIMGCLSLGDGFEEANIREVSLKEIWRSGRYFERFRSKARYLTGACLACPFGTECMAGCTALALSASGNIGENPYCIRAVETQAILSGLFE
jgi:radical SAM protein with 4Fe4S-binding SPASM domain